MDKKTISSQWSSKSSPARLEISKLVGSEQCRVRFGNGFEKSNSATTSEEFNMAQSKLQDIVASLCRADRAGTERVASEYNAQWSSLKRNMQGDKITISSNCRTI